jgi:hypothetical protein
MKEYNYMHIKLPVADGRDSSITESEYNDFIGHIKEYYGRGDGRSFGLFIKDCLNKIKNQELCEI